MFTKSEPMKKHLLFTALFVFSFSLFTFQSHAQFPHIKWWYDVHDASFGQTASGDIDKDGKPELVLAATATTVVCMR